jgi:hypothetical protein
MSERLERVSNGLVFLLFRFGLAYRQVGLVGNVLRSPDGLHSRMGEQPLLCLRR